MDIKRLSFKHKNNKIYYYLSNYLKQLIPVTYYENKLDSKLRILTHKLKKRNQFNEKYIFARVDYYNKSSDLRTISKGKSLKDLKLKDGKKTYFFDFYEHNKYFDRNLKGNFLFGDVMHIPKQPSLTKSRPISNKNKNAVLLKWNKVRHFTFVKNDKKFENKKDKLVWRGEVYAEQKHRVRFLEMHHKKAICNIARVNNNSIDNKWLKKRMTISEQLDYKFILSIEGYDVASNLKWIMSSNSIAVMPEPKFETWFMEGKLIPNYHYIAIKDDYSNLEEQLDFYIKNPEKAKAIIKNANNHVAQFKNKYSEDLISLLVLKKYFKNSGQL